MRLRIVLDPSNQFERAHPPLQPLAPEPLAEGQLEAWRRIAQGLALAEMTVCTHVSTVLGRLHLANQAQEALYALRQGWASLDGAPLTEGE